MGRTQTETITIRVTPEEKHSMQGKMYEAVAPSMRAFILDMCMNGKVIVTSDLRELQGFADKVTIIPSTPAHIFALDGRALRAD